VVWGSIAKVLGALDQGDVLLFDLALAEAGDVEFVVGLFKQEPFVVTSNVLFELIDVEL
jgi:hypothetical protein